MKIVTIDQVKIKLNSFYLYKTSIRSSLPLFVKISKIFKYNNQIFVVARLAKALYFYKKFYSFSYEMGHDVRVIDT